jgi:hypothetical protein
MGDRVVITYGLGYPLITGFLPTPQGEENAFPITIDSGQPIVDTGDYSAVAGVIKGDANKPQDLLNGDHVLASEGNAVLALLRGGSVLLKSSALAQIFMSRLDDVIKVVSRNFEHYTDVSSDIVKNLKGRIYRYIAYTNDFAKAKEEDYKYHLYYGDTALAEAVKTDYLVTPGSLPAINTTLFKEQVTADGVEVMHRTVKEDGSEEVVVTGSGGTSTVKTTSSMISFSRADGATIVLDSSGIHHSFSGGTINMTSSGISLDFGGHFVHITSTGVDFG